MKTDTPNASLYPNASIYPSIAMEYHLSGKEYNLHQIKDVELFVLNHALQVMQTTKFLYRLSWVLFFAVVIAGAGYFANPELGIFWFTGFVLLFLFHLSVCRLLGRWNKAERHYVASSFLAIRCLEAQTEMMELLGSKLSCVKERKEITEYLKKKLDKSVSS